jgi:hypothetical protein
MDEIRGGTFRPFLAVKSVSAYSAHSTAVGGAPGCASRFSLRFTPSFFLSFSLVRGRTAPIASASGDRAWSCSATSLPRSGGDFYGSF